MKGKEDIMSKISIIAELFTFLTQNKKWWILPIVLVLILLGALIIFSQGSALSPFFYALF